MDDLRRLARRIIRRLRWQRFLHRASQTVWLLAAFPLIMAAGSFGLLAWPPLPVLGALCAGWLVIAWTWAYARPLRVETALALLDVHQDNHEANLSAYCFGQEADPGPWRQEHIARAREALAGERPDLAEVVPLRPPVRILAVPLLLLGLALVPWPDLRPHRDGDDAIDSGAAAKAQAEAEHLEKLIEELDEEETSDAEEKKLKDDYREILEHIAEVLRNARESRREFLEELDSDLNELEKTAEATTGGDRIAKAIVEALKEQTVTADLGDALEENAPEGVAAAANQHAEQLEGTTSRRQRQQLGNALRQALARDASDRSTTGRQLRQAAAALAQNRPAAAARAFRQLARNAAQRGRLARLSRRMQRLARGLRRRGQALFRRGQGLRQLASAGRRMSGRQLRFSSPFGRPSRPGSMRTPMVPMGQPSGQPGMMPGTGMRPGAGMRPGQMPGMGSCPVPGQMPGMGMGSCPGQGMSPGSTTAPVPGSNGQGRGTGSTGLGRGQATRDPKAGAVVVEAPLHDVPPSSIREVAGRGGGEAARESTREVTIRTLRREEAALADEDLPLSRREHILRYFTALRKELDDGNSNP